MFAAWYCILPQCAEKVLGGKHNDGTLLVLLLQPATSPTLQQHRDGRWVFILPSLSRSNSTLKTTKKNETVFFLFQICRKDIEERENEDRAIWWIRQTHWVWEKWLTLLYTEERSGGSLVHGNWTPNNQRNQGMWEGKKKKMGEGREEGKGGVRNRKQKKERKKKILIPLLPPPFFPGIKKQGLPLDLGFTCFPSEWRLSSHDEQKKRHEFAKAE